MLANERKIFKTLKTMEIKAADVMKLRKMTGAGMMDCKKALIEACLLDTSDAADDRAIG